MQEYSHHRGRERYRDEFMRHVDRICPARPWGWQIQLARAACVSPSAITAAISVGPTEDILKRIVRVTELPLDASDALQRRELFRAHVDRLFPGGPRNWKQCLAEVIAIDRSAITRALTEGPSLRTLELVARLTPADVRCVEDERSRSARLVAELDRVFPGRPKGWQHALSLKCGLTICKIDAVVGGYGKVPQELMDALAKCPNAMPVKLGADDKKRMEFTAQVERLYPGKPAGWQVDLGKRISLSPAMISRYFNGRLVPRDPVIQAMAALPCSNFRAVREPRFLRRGRR